MSNATPNIDNGDFSAHDPWDANSIYWAKVAGHLNGENIVLRERIAELESEISGLLRFCRCAGEVRCDMRKRIAELEANNKLLRAKVEKYLKLLEELDPDSRNLAKRLK